MDSYDRMVLAMAELDVPRIRELVAVSLRQGRSITHITAQMHRYIDYIVCNNDQPLKVLLLIHAGLPLACTMLRVTQKRSTIWLT